MASEAPPTIPISLTDGDVQQQQQPPADNTPASRSCISRLSDSITASLHNQRPWHQLVDKSAFSRPESFSDITQRIRKNLSYFRINYSAVFAVILAITLVASPFSLFILLALLGCWCFLYLFRPADRPLVIFGREFSDRETILGLVGLSVVVIVFSSVVPMLMSSVTVAAVIVGVHGAFRITDDQVLHEKESNGVTCSPDGPAVAATEV